jgi:hypothetical protein
MTVLSPLVSSYLGSAGVPVGKACGRIVVMEPHRSRCKSAELVDVLRVQNLRLLEDGLFVSAQFFCESVSR